MIKIRGIKNLRIALLMTQKELASALSVTQPFISFLEKGGNCIDRTKKLIFDLAESKNIEFKF